MKEEEEVELNRYKTLVNDLIAGNLIDDVYHNWSPGEPNDADGNEDCVVMRQDGTFNDIPCFIKKPFICKKTLVTLEWNKECNMPNLGKDNFVMSKLRVRVLGSKTACNK